MMKPRSWSVCVAAVLLVAGCASDDADDAAVVATGGGEVTAASSTLPDAANQLVVEPSELANRSARAFLPSVDAPRRVGVVVTFDKGDGVEVWVQLAEDGSALNEWTVSGQTTATRDDGVITVSIADPCLTSILPEEIECETVPPFSLRLQGDGEITAFELTSAHTDALPPPFGELGGWLVAEEDVIFD